MQLNRPQFAPLTTLLTLAVLLTRSTTPGQAILRRDDRTDKVYRDYGVLSAFAAVGQVNGGGGCGTLIGPHTVLTATHLGRIRTFTLNGKTYDAASCLVYDVTRSPGNDPHFFERGVDLQLVTLKRDVADVRPAALYGDSDETGKTLSIVGWGVGGTGSKGSDSQRAKRGGMNVCDGDGSLLVGQQISRRILLSDFDSPDGTHNTLAPRSQATPAELECLFGDKDSGGGAFVQSDGKYYLAGVHSAIFTLDPKTPTFGYGSVNADTRVSAFADWIQTHSGIRARHPSSPSAKPGR